VARLSEQLRRYLDDKAWLENRRIMEILRTIEQRALAVRATPPDGALMELDEPAPGLSLPMERLLAKPPGRTRLSSQVLVDDDVPVSADALFEQVLVDKARLLSRVRQALQTHAQVSLAQLLERHPLEQGLAELVAYLSLASEEPRTVWMDDVHLEAFWTDAHGTQRRARCPQVVFTR